ncbi:MAG: hypothetical protein Fur0041_14680 [Bacteroidia bacterium]
MKNTILFIAVVIAVVTTAGKCKDRKDTDKRKQDSTAMVEHLKDSISKATAYQDSINKAQVLQETQPETTAVVRDRKHPPALPLEPTFKEGRAALEKFLADNTKYPAAAQKNNITGVVIVYFIVKKDGTLSDFKVLKGLGYGCDEEALRVAKLMPPWNPGKKDGIVVDMEYNIAVKFGVK